MEVRSLSIHRRVVLRRADPSFEPEIRVTLPPHENSFRRSEEQNRIGLAFHPRKVAKGEEENHLAGGPKRGQVKILAQNCPKDSEENERWDAKMELWRML